MAVHFIKRGAVLFYEGVQEEEEGSLFTIVRAREVRFLTRWDQHAVAQRRLYKVSRGADLFFFRRYCHGGSWAIFCFGGSPGQGAESAEESKVHTSVPLSSACCAHLLVSQFLVVVQREHETQDQPL